jgi:hypothetical protein
VWFQLAAFAVGAWLTASPGVLGFGGPTAANAHVVGPLAALFAVIAASEVTRPVRWLNLPLGGWLVVAPWVLGSGWVECANSTAVGLALAGLAGVRERIDESFGGGWRVLWEPAGRT